MPQQLVEDVLTTILRYEKPTPVNIIRQYTNSEKGLDKVLKRMLQDGLLSQVEFKYSLTEIGIKEANKVLRAHRLWETYLESIGTPEKEVHSTAHHLEHLHEHDTVDYLDKKLGNPKQDPHGKTIPD